MKAFVSATSFLKPENAAAQKKLNDFFDDAAYNDLGVPLKGDQILERLDGCSAYIAGVDYITADVIARMPDSVRVISRYGVGVDRVNLAAAANRGITVTNTPGANSTAVCELAFALMLCAARDIPRLHDAVTRGDWPRSEGIELAGRTLGIVGMGAIGKRLAVRARAFEMNVLAYDPYFDEAFAKENEIARTGLDELFRLSDVISLHLPLNDETRHLVDAGRIREMRDGAILINAARGGLIDEQAAAEALKAGKLGGLGLDAFEQEPLLDSPLKGLPHVVFTPHTGAHTGEAVANMGLMSVQNAIQVLRGEPCPYIVRG
mgnify:CR=1 FL=1